MASINKKTIAGEYFNKAYQLHLKGKIDEAIKNYLLSIEYVEKYSTVVKLEIVCEEKDTDVLTNIIVKYGKTGKSGDGMIFVSPIEKSFKIRTNQLNIL